MLQKNDVVVFDFDGTLSARDSSYEFIKYCARHSVRPWLFAPLMGVAAIARIIKRDGVWWRQSMRRFLTPGMIKRFTPDFVRQHRRERFGWARERVVAERSAGRRAVLISASPDYLLPSLVRDIKFDAVICSKMDAQKPWKYKFLCWGQNKVWALDAWARENKIIPHVVRCYSDSLSDMPLMEISDEQVWIDRKTGLRTTK